jgi:pyruvate dehydrogenase E2 component (dihydrolipoamide acetyltransferase)
MGEGLHEVCIVGFQKQPGDVIERDEPLYSMETDKAAMDVESPYEGVLTEWLVREGDILAIGAPVARIETGAAVAAPPAPASPEGFLPGRAPAGAEESREARIPPRTRAYCRELGVSEEEMRRIPAPTGKLMPADIDAYLATKTATDGSGETYVDRPLSPQHRTLIYRLKRSAEIVVPGVAKRPMEWSGIRRHADTLRERGLPLQPSAFQTFAYCVAQAVRDHPKFRSTLIGEETWREYAHVNLGIAVAGANGQLTTAVVRNADSLNFETFVRTAQEQIQRARGGEDQADESVQLHLTYMGAYEIVDAVPVLVAPAVAVLFIGSTYVQNGASLVNLALTFDHRVIQGVEAAEFLRTVVEKARQVEEINL